MTTTKSLIDVLRDIDAQELAWAKSLPVIIGGPTAGAQQQKAQLATNQADQAAEQAQAEQQLGTYNASVTGLTPSITQTQADVTGLTPSIAQAQTDVNALPGSISQAQTDVNAETPIIGQQLTQANTAAGAANSVSDAANTFAATPGYTDAEVAAMKADAAGQIHGQFGDEMTQLKADAATQGGNDAGLPSQLKSATQQRALATEQGAQNVDVAAANEAASGRRLVPGMQAQAASAQGATVGDFGQVAGTQNTQATGQGAITGQESTAATDQGAITGQLSTQATQQGNVTGAEATQAGLEYQPVSTLTNEATQTGAQDTSLIGQMPKTNPWLTTLQNGLTAAGGAAAGAAVKGAMGGSGGGGGCYVAAEIWGGWLDPRVILMRQWLWEEYATTPLGSVLVPLYGRFGEVAARAIRRSKVLRRVAAKVFGAGLRRAQLWQEGLRKRQITHGR